MSSKPSDTVISVRNLGKAYQISRQAEKHDTIAGVVLARLRHPFARPDRETFWAVQDLNFDIAQGQIVGVVGRNGAGKSTFLKLLSRITPPTTGEIRLWGRVGSLLEVGTGFHPELTGRENVYLNGSILGMSHKEIERQFDAIINFAGVERFLDTPVKRYSSGMYVRLAFAVAAHLNPEILLVDEVLAVGDSEFQKKCLGKMEDISRQGRTVLVVSHNLSIVRNLCSSALLLANGHLALHGPTEAVLREYVASGAAGSGQWKRDTPVPNEPGAYFEAIQILDRNEVPVQSLDATQGGLVELLVVATDNLPRLQVNVRVSASDGTPLFTTAHTDKTGTLLPLSQGRYRFIVEIPGDLLLPGEYNLLAGAIVPNVVAYDVVEGVAFRMEDTGSHATALRDGRLGVIAPRLHWHTEDRTTDPLPAFAKVNG